MKMNKGNDVVITPALRMHQLLVPVQILGAPADNTEVRRDVLMDLVKKVALYDVVCTLLIDKTMALSACNMKDKQHFNRLSDEYKDAMNQLQLLVDSSLGPELAGMIKEQDPSSIEDPPGNNKKDIDSP